MHWALKFPRGVTPNSAPDALSSLHVSTPIFAPEAVVLQATTYGNGLSTLTKLPAPGTCSTTTAIRTTRAMDGDVTPDYVDMAAQVYSASAARAYYAAAATAGAARPFSLHLQQQGHTQSSSPSLAILETPTTKAGPSLANPAISVSTKATPTTVVDPTTTTPLGSIKSLTAPRSRIWWENFRKIKEFYDKKGHLSLPRHDHEYRKLSDWIFKQRYKSKSLQKDQLAALESINYKTVPKRLYEGDDDWWEAWYAKLKKLYDKMGSAKVKVSQDKALYDWLLRQKRLSRKKSLDLSRKERLEQLGVDFTKCRTKKDGKNTKRAALWYAQFEKLKEYKKIHGDCNVRKVYGTDPSLGEWAQGQRYIYARSQRGEITPMDPDRIEKLNSIGFEWSF